MDVGGQDDKHIHPHRQGDEVREREPTTMAPGKMRWGDAADVQGTSVHGEAEPWSGRTKNDLPPPQIYGPDEKGIKTTVEYRYNEEGQKVKITKKTRVLKKKKVISKDTMARKQWEKFGDAKGIAPGTDNLTAVSTDEIYVERPKKLGMKQEDEQVRRRRTHKRKKYTRMKESRRGKTERFAHDVEHARRGKKILTRIHPRADMQQSKPDALAALAGTNTSLLVCRICGKKGDHWTSKCPYKVRGKVHRHYPPPKCPRQPEPGR